MNWYVYILECCDRTLYTGITTNLEKRLRQHNGEIVGGAKYTEHKRPVSLVYSELVCSRSEALKREHAIKSMKRGDKLSMIELAEIK